MRFVFFVHSLVSDWNHGNAHFLRGVIRELQDRGHPVRVLEPADGWSRRHLLAERGEAALQAFARRFPSLSSETYAAGTPSLDEVLDGADVVVAHEWNEPALIAALGRHRRTGGHYQLLFHDTHHRSISDSEGIGGLDLNGFDGVLAFGETVREVYLRRGWSQRVWTWHEAADVQLFRPRPGTARTGEVVWIGNWGDGERSAELRTFLLDPVRRLGCSGTVHGVRYPADALAALDAAGLAYGGWLANAEVPDVFARHRLTVHVPRRPYALTLKGIPTIRVFEALACGIPLISAPWAETEGLFQVGHDFLMVRDGDEMTRAMRAVLAEPALADELAAHGLETIRARHTCGHRADELLAICRGLGGICAEAAD